MSNHSRRRALVDLLIEALLIVFSVLLALEASQWRAQHEARQRLDAAKQHIRVELENNQAILRNMIPYHEAVVRRVGRLLARRDLSDQLRGRSFTDMTNPLMPRGVWNPTVSPQDLSDSAWRSALSDHSASQMSPQLLNTLTAYYAMQNSGVQHTLQFTLQQLLAPAMFDPHSTLLMLRASQGWLNELVGEEKELLAHTKGALNALAISASAEAMPLQGAKRTRGLPAIRRGGSKGPTLPVVAVVLLAMVRQTERCIRAAEHRLDDFVCASA